jgi:hypothetical protein
MKVNVAIDDDKGLKSFPHRRKMRVNQKLRKFDTTLILEKLQHYFRKFPKIKSFSQRQSKGWLFGDYQMRFSSL